MPNPFKLGFTLKQHTPLIHFQHDQPNPTIRATELKPKLDKFIIEHVFHNKFEDAKKYLVGYPFDDTSEKGLGKVEELRQKFDGKEQFRALDYKVTRIHGILKAGNEGRGTTMIIGNPANWIWFQSIEIEITFFCMKLKGEVEKILQDFFILSRFGKRQSKGYGQFTVFKETNVDFRSVLKRYYTEHHEKQVNIPPLLAVSQEIEGINRLLKSGNNRPYKKASIFLEAIERTKPFRWEKRLIKRAINIQNTFNYELEYEKGPIDLESYQNNRYKYLNSFNDVEESDNYDEDEYSKTQYRFFRALLGLAEHYEFLVFQNKNRKFVAVVKSENNNIERFQSPITFRYFDGFIIVTAEKIPDEMFYQNFYFELQMKEKNIYDKEIIENLLNDVGFDEFVRTPKKIEFSLPKFLEKYLPEQGFKKY